MRDLSMKKLLFTTTALALFAPMAVQAAEADQAEPSSEIIVTGTRQTGMRAADSAAPIQLIGTQAFQSVGQQDLTQVLAQTLPSLNFQGFGGDTANLTLSAALRGINPNDTLVLINGKRRHTTANLAVLGGSPYSGSATTDLSFIPTNAIGRIEVLQDGAAAQYGSDAIAGVVNIMLKNNDHGGSFTATGGSNYANGGSTAATALNLGFKLGEKGFINVTGEYRFHDYTSHGKYDRRFYYANGQLKPGQSSVVTNGLAGAPNTPNVNTINGDARYTIYNLSFNAGYDVGSDAQVYAFGSYGNRNAKAYQNYRSPSRVSGVTSTGTTVYPLPNGFQPQENIREEDFSLTAGIKGKAAEWNYDLSLTYGKDAVALYTINSANPTLFAMQQSASATPLTGLQRNFYDGQLSNSEWVGNIDISRDFDLGMSKPLTWPLVVNIARATIRSRRANMPRTSMAAASPIRALRRPTPVRGAVSPMPVMLTLPSIRSSACMSMLRVVTNTIPTLVRHGRASSTPAMTSTTRSVSAARFRTVSALRRWPKPIIRRSTLAPARPLVSFRRTRLRLRPWLLEAEG
jgi:iron complex outermembrane receptor protein